MEYKKRRNTIAHKPAITAKRGSWSNKRELLKRPATGQLFCYWATSHAHTRAQCCVLCSVVWMVFVLSSFFVLYENWGDLYVFAVTVIIVGSVKLRTRDKKNKSKCFYMNGISNVYRFLFLQCFFYAYFNTERNFKSIRKVELKCKQCCYVF